MRKRIALLQLRTAAAQSLRTQLCLETRSNADLVIRDSCGVQILINQDGNRPIDDVL